MSRVHRTPELKAKYEQECADRAKAAREGRLGTYTPQIKYCIQEWNPDTGLPPAVPNQEKWKAESPVASLSPGDIERRVRMERYTQQRLAALRGDTSIDPECLWNMTEDQLALVDA